MKGITIHEFDVLVPEQPGSDAAARSPYSVPVDAYQWLEQQCLQISESRQDPWIRLVQRRGRRGVQVTSFVGVLRTPGGYQIEVLPKVGRIAGSDERETRQLLLDMLACLPGFRHIKTDSAALAATRMPLLEIFIAEFLRTTAAITRRGLRSQYNAHEDNLAALRGKLLFSAHLRQNLARADRFYTEHDEFSANRPENRLIRTALRRVLSITVNEVNQRHARELDFAFADVPMSTRPKEDFDKVRLDRGMSVYAAALAWAKLILDEQSPLTGAGDCEAPSLLFPMERVFEAYVARHLVRQLPAGDTLGTQVRSRHLVLHRDQRWFRLKPDLVVRDGERDRLVLDTKWKLLDTALFNGTDKYGLSQADFYQLHSYGQSYLGGEGNVVLVYPRTSALDGPLHVFDFPASAGLKLWVIPFCLRQKRLMLPVDSPLGLSP